LIFTLKKYQQNVAVRDIISCTCSAIVIAFIKGYLTWLDTQKVQTSVKTQDCLRQNELTENDGRANGGPSKLQGMKLTNMKMTDQKWRQGVKLQKKKIQCFRDNIRLHWSVQCFAVVNF